MGFIFAFVNGIIFAFLNPLFLEAWTAMLEKLQELEQVLAHIKTQYHVLATELANLKNKPNNEAKHTATINELMEKLSDANQCNEQLQAQLTQNSEQKDEALALQARQISELTEQNQLLIEQNQNLTQKVTLAHERIKTIETWLKNIEQAKNDKPTA